MSAAILTNNDIAGEKVKPYKELICETTGKPLSECNAKFEDAHPPVPSMYEPSLESGTQRCSQCGMVRHYTREAEDES